MVNWVALSVRILQNPFLNTTLKTGNSDRDLSWFSSVSPWKFRSQYLNFSHHHFVPDFFFSVFVNYQFI